jgi:hypothetical protein
MVATVFALTQLVKVRLWILLIIGDLADVCIGQKDGVNRTPTHYRSTIVGPHAQLLPKHTSSIFAIETLPSSFL